MTKEQALKLVKITRETYDLIGADFATTRNKPWVEMDVLASKYVRDGQKILDVGCGNGRLLKLLKGRKIDYWGLDGAAVLLEEAKKKLAEFEVKKMGRVEFRQFNILDLPELEEKEFDIVFMFASFNHLPSEELRLQALKDVRQILKVGGLLVMTNWNMWQIGKEKKSIWNYKLWRTVHGEKYKTENLDDIKEEMAFKDVMTFWQSRDGKAKGGLYYRAFTRGELRRLFKKAGFKILENYYANQGKKVFWWRGRNVVTVGVKQ
jgi:ubiquinone/menaquinone biosynthesis C-methylase UbiE